MSASDRAHIARRCRWRVRRWCRRAAPAGQAAPRPRSPNLGRRPRPGRAGSRTWRWRACIRPPGYEVNLFASEREFPELANPLAMTFDDARPAVGAHVADLPARPARRRSRNDKLVILEDTDGDGRADKLTVFADGLYIPTGFELGDGGVYVSQQPNLMFLQATPTATARPTSAASSCTASAPRTATTPSTPSPGAPAAACIFQEGTFLHSQVETPYGPVRLEDAGVFRYEPRTEKLERVRLLPLRQPVGPRRRRWGQNFISDASNGDNYYGTAFSGPRRLPAQAAADAGVDADPTVRPTARHRVRQQPPLPRRGAGQLPAQQRHRLPGHQAVQDASRRARASSAIEIEPLLQSSDPNFRPVALQFGPDGALYVVDWFNPLVGHMQYSLRDRAATRRTAASGGSRRRAGRWSRRRRIDGRADRGAARPAEGVRGSHALSARGSRCASGRPKQSSPRSRRGSRRSIRRIPDYEHHLLEALWVYQHHDVVEPGAARTRLLQAEGLPRPRRRRAGAALLVRSRRRCDGHR